MLAYRIKSYLCTHLKHSAVYLHLFIIMLLIIPLVSGCVSPPSNQQYANSEFGISLEKPQNWELEFHERDGSIILEADNENGDSARVEIIGYACNHSLTFAPYEHLESDIDRIRILYELDAITVVQEPSTIEIGNNKVTWATITVPTTSMPENSARNQVKDRSPNIYQPIDIFDIRNGDANFTMAYIYKGNSDVLNDEAQEIVNSIELTCSATP